EVKIIFKAKKNFTTICLSDHDFCLGLMRIMHV
ncbi:MAG: hypothetical protein ACI8RD_005790, partial [Bacillariaceae sp.]